MLAAWADPLVGGYQNGWTATAKFRGCRSSRLNWKRCSSVLILFSIGGEKRLISEQDQWIAPNRLRVIWR